MSKFVNGNFFKPQQIWVFFYGEKEQQEQREEEVRVFHKHLIITELSKSLLQVVCMSNTGKLDNLETRISCLDDWK